MIVVDTSFVIALMDRRDAGHRSASGWLESVDEDLVTTPLALAEMDHLVRRLGGPTAAEALYADLDSGAYLVDWWSGAVADTLAVAGRHAALGLVDASLVALAGRLGTRDVATFDQRHFRATAPLTGEGSFRLLPADAG